MGSDALTSSIISDVPKMSGRGKSVQPPQDRTHVYNSIVKPFTGNELDRKRQTEIMDFIILKKKQRQHERKEALIIREYEAQKQMLAKLD